METWKDGIVDDQYWAGEGRSKRLLIVCPEPNQSAMGSDLRRDSRDLLLLPEIWRGKRGEKPFYCGIRQAVRAFLGLPSGEPDPGARDQADLAKKIAFINLKNTGGRGTSVPVEILSETQRRQAELINTIMTIRPTWIFVAGGNAQAAFDKHLLQQVRDRYIAVKALPTISRIPHPSMCGGSRGWSPEEYYRRVRVAMAESTH